MFIRRVRKKILINFCKDSLSNSSFHTFKGLSEYLKNCYTPKYGSIPVFEKAIRNINKAKNDAIHKTHKYLSNYKAHKTNFTNFPSLHIL